MQSSSRSIPISLSSAATPLDRRLTHLFNRFLHDGRSAEVTAQLLPAHLLCCRIDITTQLHAQPPDAHSGTDTPSISPIHEVLELQGGLSSLSVGYQVHCDACGYVSTPAVPADRVVGQLQRLLCRSHTNPSTGAPCSHLKQLQDTHDFLQKFAAQHSTDPQHMPPTAPQQLPGTAAADPLSNSHANMQQPAGTSSPGPASDAEEEAEPPEPQATRLMALVLANLALHIISTTAATAPRGKAKAGSADLRRWRAWAIKLLTEDVDLIEHANWVRPAPSALIATLTAPQPAAPAASPAAPEASSESATAFKDPSSIPVSILDMLLAPPWPAISEPGAVENLALERLAVLLRHWHAWQLQHHPAAAAAAAAAISKQGYLLQQRKHGLQVLLEGVLALDPVCRTLPEPQRLQLFLTCAGISGSIDQALVKLDKALRSKPHITEHLEACAHCGLSAQRLRAIYRVPTSTKTQGRSGSVLNKCSNCIVSVCVPCVLAAAGMQDPGQAATAGSVGDTQAAEAAECWPDGLCWWCAGSSAGEQQQLSPPRAAAAAGDEAGSAAAAAAAAASSAPQQQPLLSLPRAVAGNADKQQMPVSQHAAAASVHDAAREVNRAAFAGASSTGAAAAAGAAIREPELLAPAAALMPNGVGDNSSDDSGSESGNNSSPSATAALSLAMARAVDMMRHMQQQQQGATQHSHDSPAASEGPCAGSQGAPGSRPAADAGCTSPDAALAPVQMRNETDQTQLQRATQLQHETQLQHATQMQHATMLRRSSQLQQEQERACERESPGVQDMSPRSQAMQDVLAAFQQLSPGQQLALLQQVRKNHARRSSTEEDSGGCETPEAGSAAVAAAAAAAAEAYMPATQAPASTAVNADAGNACSSLQGQQQQGPGEGGKAPLQFGVWPFDASDTALQPAAPAPGWQDPSAPHAPQQHRQQKQQQQQHKRQRQPTDSVEEPGVMPPQQKQPRLSERQYAQQGTLLGYSEASAPQQLQSQHSQQSQQPQVQAGLFDPAAAFMLGLTTALTQGGTSINGTNHTQDTFQQHPGGSSSTSSGQGAVVSSQGGIQAGSEPHNVVTQLRQQLMMGQGDFLRQAAGALAMGLAAGAASYAAAAATQGMQTPAGTAAADAASASAAAVPGLGVVPPATSSFAFPAAAAAAGGVGAGGSFYPPVVHSAAAAPAAGPAAPAAGLRQLQVPTDGQQQQQLQQVRTSRGTSKAGQLPPRYRSTSLQPASPAASMAPAAAAAPMGAFQVAAGGTHASIPGGSARAAATDPPAHASHAANGWVGPRPVGAAAAAAAAPGYTAVGTQDISSSDMDYLDGDEHRALETLLDMRHFSTQQPMKQKQQYSRQQHVQQRDQGLLWQPEMAAAAAALEEQRKQAQQQQVQHKQLQQQMTQVGFESQLERSKSPAAVNVWPAAQQQRQQQQHRLSRTTVDSDWEMTPEAPSILHQGFPAYGSVPGTLQGLQHQPYGAAAFGGSASAPMVRSQSPQVHQELQLQLQQLGAAAEREASLGPGRQASVREN